MKITSQRPSRECTLMEVAELYARRSTCSRAHVGAVIAHEGRILSTGYNGSPAGMPHCDHSDGSRDSEGCRTAVHAEANSIAFAAKHGIRILDSELYTTFSPCLACAQLIVNAGIIAVYIRNEYRLKDGEDLLRAAGIDIIRL
jgi:dCMP deaminase